MTRMPTSSVFEMGKRFLADLDEGAEIERTMKAVDSLSQVLDQIEESSYDSYGYSMTVTELPADNSMVIQTIMP